MDVLDHAFIRNRCNVCGQHYEVPLSDILLSHSVVRCGCPVAQETECPPVFQVLLSDQQSITALRSAWQHLAIRAEANGGKLVLREGKSSHSTTK